MALNRHHQRASHLIGLTALLVILLGIWLGHATGAGAWHGMYCTTGLATTDGCDLPLHGWQAYTVGELSMVLMIPLWTAVFSFIAAGLTADHIDKRMS